MTLEEMRVLVARKREEYQSKAPRYPELDACHATWVDACEWFEDLLDDCTTEPEEES